MSSSEDVSNLFRKFGGQPEDYQELSRDFQAEESKARWPLLSSVRLAREAIAPSVSDGETPVVTAPVPNLPASTPTAPVGGIAPFAPPPADIPAPVERVAAAAPRVEAPAPRGGVLTRSLFRKSSGTPAAPAPAPATAPTQPVPAAAEAPPPAPAASPLPATVANNAAASQPVASSPAPQPAAKPILPTRTAPAAPAAASGPLEPSFKQGQGLASLAQPKRVYPSAAASVSAAHSQGGPLSRLKISAGTGNSDVGTAGTAAAPAGEVPDAASATAQSAGAGSRQLTDILSRIAGSPAPAAAEPKKSSLFARLSRL